MKINKIVLYNFNSFEGLNEFDFSSTGKDQNIILIGGKNGAGKTSLFSAIKIALYGPLAFGYIGINSHYIAKIKDCINSRAFQTEKVESRVQITISLMVEREIKDYDIIREWDYSKHKLVENYYVKVNGERLDKQELSYFQNYLQSLVPMDLFEFFLFDGEEVGSLFSTSNYNAYVKNAVYTLCGLDIYEIIRKYTGGYIGRAATENEQQLYDEYDQLRKTVEELEDAKFEIDIELVSMQEELEQAEMELVELETAFKNAGGITDSKRKKLIQEYEKAEHIKAEAIAKIKFFVEDLMPFYIVKEFAGKITHQLDIEEKGEIYYYVQQKLDRTEIQKVLSEDVPVSSIDDLMDMLLAKFKPKGFNEEWTPVHDLSKEDTGRVNTMISMVNDFDSDALIETIKQKQAASEYTMEINKILKSAMTDEEAAKFAEKENILLKKKAGINCNIYEHSAKLEELTRDFLDLSQQRDRAFKVVKDNAQNKHVFELSTGLSSMMDTLLSGKMIEIKKSLEGLIVENLKHIYRKNNLITYIEIDEEFQFNLYQDAKYTASELAYLMKNLGKDSFALAVGKKGKEVLFKRYGVNTITELQMALSFDTAGSIDLYKNIDLSRLSKGERQIFILSLYWAIIKLSGKDIPFIIDTPYARIDANHRKEISEKFFPNISEQVIILSTDEEISEEYYTIIKPYIAKEYLLINDENQNKTSVDNHYFFGV